MKKYLISFALCLLLSPFILQTASAQGNFGNAMNHLGTVGQRSGVSSNTSLPSLVGTVINTALTLVGLIFLILMVYAGFLWLTARGEEEPVSKAKRIISTAIIGLIVVMSAYAITVLVTSRFGGASCVPAVPESGTDVIQDCSRHTEYTQCETNPRCSWIGTIPN